MSKEMCKYCQEFISYQMARSMYAANVIPKVIDAIEMGIPPEEFDFQEGDKEAFKEFWNNLMRFFADLGLENEEEIQGWWVRMKVHAGNCPEWSRNVYGK